MQHICKNLNWLYFQLAYSLNLLNLILKYHVNSNSLPQAAELQKELVKDRPDPVSQQLNEYQKTLKSSIAAALEEHKHMCCHD